MKQIKYVSTNLKNDNEIDITKLYKFVVNKYRNGNLDLIDIKTNKVVLKLQNNEVE